METAGATPLQQKMPKRRKTVLLGLAVLFLILGAGWAAYWALFLRNMESTDDAYVAGYEVSIMAQTEGNVIDVLADDTDFVRAGDVLVRLDATDAKLALENAIYELAGEVREMQRLRIESVRLDAVVEQREKELAKLRADLKRRIALGKRDALAEEELQHARDYVLVAEAALREAREQRKANQALLLDTPLEKQPAILLAAQKVRETWLALKRTDIKSPVSGFVAKRNIQAGGRAVLGKALMIVAPLESVWVDANFKEIQLGRIRIGQRAEITADMYGDDVVYHGTVAGFEAGTGSVFSLLPPQNATGNWIKIVQRVPVRIRLEPAELKQRPLMLGLSAMVRVDTSDSSGPMLTFSPGRRQTMTTTALAIDMTEADALIDSIIKENAGAETGV